MIKRFSNSLNKISTKLNNLLFETDRYKLVAIISHEGKSRNFGHYRAFELINNGEMIAYDDKSATKMPYRE